ncbi:MAG: alkaline phosphatase family protein [Halioglobus sp.]
MNQPVTPANRKKPKTLLIGWDAADWKVIHPLIEAGRMPNIARLIERGVMGNLATLHPVLSPMLWTSIATGKRPFKHGILGFTEPTPDGGAVQPVSQLSRSTKAIWNILNQTGHKCGVVGWWPSHPVEAINGVMVGNHFHHAVGPPDQPWPLPPGGIHPEHLSATLAELRFNPNELVPEEVLPFIPKALEIDQAKDRRLGSMMKILAECISINNAATWLLENDDWDFFAVYYDAIDHFSHGFMKYHPPRQDWISERDFELYSGVVNAGYEFHDMMLGTMLELVDEDTTIVMCSDHGFHPDHLRPRQIPREPAGPAVEHRDLGMFLIAGPEFKKDELIHGANLLDITPTLLTLYGLPVGDDMDGKPLLHAFEVPPKVERIPSWDAVAGDDGRHSETVRQDPLAAKAALDQLVALGYIEAPGDNAAQAVARAAREMRYNLAASYMDADLYPQAIAIFGELYEAEPEDSRFGKQLAMCHRAMGNTQALRELVEQLRVTRGVLKERATERIEKMRQVLHERREARKAAHRAAEGTATESKAAQPLLSRKERDEWKRLREQKHATNYDLDFLMSCVLLDENRLEEAMEYLALAGEAQPNRPGLHIQIGLTYLKMRRAADAETAFRKALVIDPLNFHAHLGLARACHRQRRYEEAAGEALATVRMTFHYPMAHFILGSALFRLRRFEAAAQSLAVAADLNPNFVQAHRLLVRLYRYWIDDPRALTRHRDALRDLKQMKALNYRESLAVMQDEFAEAPGGEGDALARTASEAPVPQATGEYTSRLPAADAPAQFVTIVAGLPRSGTSMLMQMLDAGGMEILTDNKRKADEDNPRGYYELQKATQLRTKRDWVKDARNKAVKIVAQLLPYVPRDEPCRVVFIERDSAEVLASQRTMLSRQKRGEDKFSDEQIRSAYRRQVSLVKDWLAHNPNAWVLYVRHQDIISDPAGAAAAINAFLGGFLDEDKMAQVVDTGLYRNRAARAASLAQG